MPTPLHTPRVNNNDDVVRLLRVLVKPGDRVSAGDIVAEVETDKANFTIEAEQSGFVLAVIPQVQDMIDVGSVLLWVGAAAGRSGSAGSVRARASDGDVGTDGQGGSAAGEVRLARV